MSTIFIYEYIVALQGSLGILKNFVLWTMYRLPGNHNLPAFSKLRYFPGVAKGIE